MISIKDLIGFMMMFIRGVHRWLLFIIASSLNLMTLRIKFKGVGCEGFPVNLFYLIGPDMFSITSHKMA